MTFSKNSTITCFSEFFVLTCGVRFPQPSGESFESTCMQGLAEGCKLTLYMEKSRDVHSFDFRMLYKFDNMRVARVRNRSFGEEFSIEIFTSIDVTLDLVRTWLSKKGLVVDRAILGHSLHRKEKYVPGIFLMS